jgi:two-component system NtrC family sensor kinase
MSLQTEDENILIIDDDESTCRTMKMILDAYGYNTEYVHFGKDAIERVKNASFSLAIVDVRLPDVPGTELISRLREESPDLAIIMVTGYASIESVVDAMNLGASAYATKPLDVEQLIMAVTSAIEKRKLLREKKKMEEDLRRNETWFRNIFNDSPIAINVFNKDGDFVNANQACLEFAGVKRVKDLENFNIFSDPNLSEEMRARLKRGESTIFESAVDFAKVRELGLYETVRSDVAYVESAISPLIIGDRHEIQGYMVQMVDITKRKSAEREVIEERDKAQLYLDIAGVMFIALNPQGNITLINRRGCEILKTTAESAVGKNWFTTFLPPESREEIHQLFTTILDDNPNRVGYYVNPVLTTSGEQRIIRWDYVALTNDEGTVVSVLSSGIDMTEQMQAEAALRRSEDELRRVFNESPVGIEVIDDSGCIIDMNPAALEIFGVTDPTQLVGFDVLADPNTPETVKEYIRTMKSHRFESTFSFELVKEDGLYDTSKSGIRHLDTILTPLGSTPDGTSAGMMIQFQDVTEKKLAHAALKESEEKWRSYTQGSPDHITIIDSNLNIQFTNRLAEGQALDDVIGKCMLDFLPDAQRAAIGTELGRILKTGESTRYETTYRTPVGQSYFYETRAIPRVVDNKIVGVTLSSRDITESKVAQQQIAYQANLLQNISDAVISEDLEFRIQSLNRAAETLYGWKSEEVVNKPVMDLLHNEYTDTTREDVAEHLNLLGSWNGELVQTRRNGSKVYVHAAMSYILDASGNRTGIVSVNRDITERVLAEHDLRSERDRAMLYLDIMGHDIRNQLQAITLGLDIIDAHTQEEATHDIFEDVQETVEKCSGIISSIKKTERLAETPLEAMNVGEAIRRSVEEFLRNNTTAEVEVNDAADGQKVLIDRYFDVMVFSLLENAIVHNTKRSKRVWVDARRVGDKFVLSVSDNGPGFSDNRKQTLFDKARRFGGVGLHQIKQIADKYHGQIQVKDRIQGSHQYGTVFQILLPIYNESNG